MLDWINQNAGVVSVLIFISSLLFGWVSGIFRGLMRKPKFDAEILPGPTFTATFKTGEKFKEYEVHQTGIALYLRITNTGSAPSDIKNISVGYHWNITNFNLLWLRYRLFWFWLKEQILIMKDFQYEIMGNIKIYPFLFQKSFLQAVSQKDLYLREGQNAIGVVYFEQKDSFGACFPFEKNGRTKIKVRIEDSYENFHTKIFSIPVVSIEDAKRYNPSFGETFRLLNQSQKTKRTDS